MRHEWSGSESCKSDASLNWFTKLSSSLLFNVEPTCMLGLIRGSIWSPLTCKETKRNKGTCVTKIINLIEHVQCHLVIKQTSVGTVLCHRVNRDLTKWTECSETSGEWIMAKHFCLVLLSWSRALSWPYITYMKSSLSTLLRLSFRKRHQALWLINALNSNLNRDPRFEWGHCQCSWVTVILFLHSNRIHLQIDPSQADKYCSPRLTSSSQVRETILITSC